MRRIIFAAITVLGLILDIRELVSTLGVSGLLNMAGIAGIVLIIIGGGLFTWDWLKIKRCGEPQISRKEQA